MQSSAVACAVAPSSGRRRVLPTLGASLPLDPLTSTIFDPLNFYAVGGYIEHSACSTTGCLGRVVGSFSGSQALAFVRAGRTCYVLLPRPY